MENGQAQADRAAADRTTRFGQPTGLWVLSGTELWDRISFHGMQAMLVLYMAGELLKPGRIEKVIGFAQYRAVIEAMTGPLSDQAIAEKLKEQGFQVARRTVAKYREQLGVPPAHKRK